MMPAKLISAIWPRAHPNWSCMGTMNADMPLTIAPIVMARIRAEAVTITQRYCGCGTGDVIGGLP